MMVLSTRVFMRDRNVLFLPHVALLGLSMALDDASRVSKVDERPVCADRKREPPRRLVCTHAPIARSRR